MLRRFKAAVSAVLVAVAVRAAVYVLVRLVSRLWGLFSMSYSPPTFNLTVNIWRWANWVGTVPPVVAPDIVATGNLRMLKTAFVASSASGYGGDMLCALPMLTDVRGFIGWGGTLGNPDLMEVPAASGRFYVVNCVDDVAKGFTNEYRAAHIQQWSGVAPWPIP